MMREETFRHWLRNTYVMPSDPQSILHRIVYNDADWNMYDEEREDVIDVDGQVIERLELPEKIEKEMT